MKYEELKNRFFRYNRFSLIEGLILTFIGYVYGLFVASDSINDLKLFFFVELISLIIFFIVFKTKR